MGKDFGVVQAAGECGNQSDTQNEAEVTDAVDQKGLHIGEDRSGLVEPKTNQQIRHQTYRLPPEEQLQEIVAHHQHQHGKREQGDVGEEAVVALILMHVTDGVDVHHERDKGDYAHHHGGQAIHQKTNLHLERANSHPLVNRLVKTCALGDRAVQCHGRQDERNQHAQNGQAVGGTASNPVATQAGAQHTGHQSTGQRSQGNGQQYRRGQGLAHLLSP